MSIDPLVSTSDLGMYLQQDLSEYEPEAAYAVNLASAAVRGYCRRTFTYVEDDVRVFRWRRAIVLPDPPVHAITAVRVEEVDADWYRDERGDIVVAPGSPTGDEHYPFPDIEVTYTHGYLEVPEIVPIIAVRIAARAFKNPTLRTTYAADSMTYQSSSDVAPRMVTADEQMLLRPYRLNRVAT